MLFACASAAWATAAAAATGLTGASAFVFAPPLTARYGSMRTLSPRGSPRRVLTYGRVVRVIMLSSAAAPSDEEGKFFRMGGAEDAQSFGPRCVLAGGVSLENCNAILSILEEAVDLQLQEEQGEDRDETDIPLVVFTPGIADETVGAVLRDGVAISRRQDTQLASELASTTPVKLASPVILVSGFTNTQLRNFAARFRRETGVRAAFAKAVPNAMEKPVARLCGEIAQDHADALAGKLNLGREGE